MRPADIQRRAYGSIRRYGASDLARVKFVKSAQHLGFSLEEIAFDVLERPQGSLTPSSVVQK